MENTTQQTTEPSQGCAAPAGSPIKERELRALATCGMCGRKLGQTSFPCFWRVTIDRHLLDIGAVRRQTGFGMMMGAHLAGLMGPDEDMTKPLMDKITVMICEDCGTDKINLAFVVENSGNDQAKP